MAEKNENLSMRIGPEAKAVIEAWLDAHGGTKAEGAAALAELLRRTDFAEEYPASAEAFDAIDELATKMRKVVEGIEIARAEAVSAADGRAAAAIGKSEARAAEAEGSKAALAEENADLKSSLADAESELAGAARGRADVEKRCAALEGQLADAHARIEEFKKREAEVAEKANAAEADRAARAEAEKAAVEAKAAEAKALYAVERLKQQAASDAAIAAEKLKSVERGAQGWKTAADNRLGRIEAMQKQIDTQALENKKQAAALAASEAQADAAREQADRLMAMLDRQLGKPAGGGEKPAAAKKQP